MAISLYLWRFQKNASPPIPAINASPGRASINFARLKKASKNWYAHPVKHTGGGGG
ncbi:MAG: hypothetical protein LBC53_10405 [Spirochaetaceae bacterium]|nr:hypothetical protein [Spirochaetaceae bacterium]